MALELTPTQARVIGSLVEKSITTPQYYPLTTNSVVSACNQKSSRDPVMSLGEGEVGSALIQLEELRLVKRDDQLGRVPKWRHRFQHELLIKEPAMAVLVTLMLRGPQTLAELRVNAAPLHGPADAAGVQAVLDDLADRAHPLVVMLPRQAGQSAARVTHLLCGAVDPGSPATDEPPPRSSVSEPRGVAALEARVAALEQRLAELERLLA